MVHRNVKKMRIPKKIVVLLQLRLPIKKGNVLEKKTYKSQAKKKQIKLFSRKKVFPKENGFHLEVEFKMFGKEVKGKNMRIPKKSPLKKQIPREMRNCKKIFFIKVLPTKKTP